MTTICSLEHSLIPNECFWKRIQELAEKSDHEYYMSASFPLTRIERAIRGQARIREVIEEFKQLFSMTKCTPCRDEIAKQLLLQEEGLQEIANVLDI